MVLVIYQEIVTRYYGPPPASTPPAIENKETQSETSATPAPSASNAPAPVAKVAQPATPGRPAKDVRVETENYVAVFTTQGARLKSFTFKNYRSAVDVHSPSYDIVQTAPGVPLPLGEHKK